MPYPVPARPLYLHLRLRPHARSLAEDAGGGGEAPPTALPSSRLSKARRGAGALRFRQQRVPNCPLAEG